MTILEAIERRQSRRSYLGTPIEPAKLRQLAGLAERYNAAGSLSMELLLDGGRAFGSLAKSYGMFHNVRTLILLKGDRADPHLDEKLGRYGELLVLEATRMGLGTCWVGGTFDRGTVAVKAQEQLPCVITVGNIAPELALREKLIHRAIHRKTRALEELFTTDCPAPPWFLEGMKAVQRAPSAANRQPVRFACRNGEVSAFVENTGRFALVDLGIAKAHFELASGGTFELGNHGKFQRQPG